jgi:hypothetical protein
MKKYIVAFLAVVSFYSCTSEEKKSVQVEEPESEFIYRRDRQFTFLASHFDKSGNLTDLDTLFLTTNGKVINEQYGQTYSSWTSTGNEFGNGYTGITEHDTTVWIHPPRSGRYKKLELSPFPMIKYPLQPGNEWTWSLLVGNHYSIEGFAEWDDKTNEEFNSTYKITRKLPLKTPVGMVNCFEIDSSTKSKFERTELKAYFNTDYGFVKLDYKNIDQGRLLMELIEVEYAQSGTKLPFKDLKI